MKYKDKNYDNISKFENFYIYIYFEFITFGTMYLFYLLKKVVMLICLVFNNLIILLFYRFNYIWRVY